VAFSVATAAGERNVCRLGQRQSIRPIVTPT
jgi:hypothetical protein